MAMVPYKEQIVVAPASATGSARSQDQLSELRFLEACRILCNSDAVLNVPGSWQATMLTDFQTIKERMALSVLNRDVSSEKVRAYEAWLPLTLIPGDGFYLKPHDLTVGLLKHDLVDNARRGAVADEDDEVVHTITAKVQDGQHRLSAMLNLYKRNPAINFPILLKVNMCKDEAEFAQQVKAMNMRMEFTAKDAEKVSTVTTIKQAVLGKVIEKHRRKRCVNALQNVLERRLEDKAFVARYRGRTQADLETSVKNTAAKYRARWQASVDRVAASRYTARDKVIDDTKMYQMVDESCEWLDRL